MNYNNAFRARESLTAQFPAVKGWHIKKVGFSDLARANAYAVTADNWAGEFENVKQWLKNGNARIKNGGLFASR